MTETCEKDGRCEYRREEYQNEGKKIKKIVANHGWESKADGNK